MTARRRSGGPQSGMGLMFVLGLGLLVMGMGALAHMLLTTSLNTSARHVSQEQAFNLAEEGVERTIARLNKDASYNTDADFGPMPAGTAGIEGEEAWVRDRLAAAPPAAVRPASGGDVTVIKPSNADVVYAAAWVPSRASAKSLRVLRSEYVPDGRRRLSHAVLAAGSVTFAGNPKVSGTSGNVHSNANADIGGSPQISGSLTVSGAFTRLGGTVGGTTAAGEPPLDVPAIAPRDIWDRHAASSADGWYDLCADGTVRRPTGATPCAGTVLATATATTFRGWRLSGSTWSFAGDASFGGVYYAYRGGMAIGGNAGSAGVPWQATLIAEAAVTAAAAAGCDQRAQGDIYVAGSVSPTAYLEGLLLVAGRDLTVEGTPSQVFTGILTSQEQLRIAGTATLLGVAIAQRDCDTAGSPVAANLIDGNMSIRYDGNLGVATDGSVRTTLWSEL